MVALRFPDPEGRTDDAGRVIVHEIVALPPASEGLTAEKTARDAVWPLLAAAFTELWLLPQAPTEAEIRAALEGVHTA